MPSRRETRPFVAHDGSGKRFDIVAERFVAPVRGPCTYRTSDWRIVRRHGPPGCYTVEPDNIPLTTRDPNEPKD
jgi:hypothetical protein